MAEERKREQPYFPEQGIEQQRAAFYVSDRISPANLGYFITPQDLHGLGYPEDFSKVEAFGAGFTKPIDKHINRTKALVEATSQLGYTYDDGIKAMLVIDLIKDGSLTMEEKKEAFNFIDGMTLTLNYYNRLKGSGGNAGLFVATTEMSRGGVVSPDDNARLNIRHLRAIVKFMPEVSDAIAIMDREYSRRFDLDDQHTWKHRGPQEILDEIDLAGVNKTKADNVKLIARAWYELLGMPDIRAFQHKDQIVQKFMPKPLTDKNGIVNYSEYRERYKNNPNLFLPLDVYRGIPLEYNSVFAFDMDPLKLQSGVLKNYKGIGVELAMIARYGDQSNKHNIFNLGWTPAGFKIIESIAGKPLQYDDLSNLDFSNTQLKLLNDEQWKKIEETVDWQKIMINQLEKADSAKVAFLKLFSFDPKAIGDMYSSVMSYLRDSKKSTEDQNIFTRGEILPMLTSAVIRIFIALKERGTQLVEKSQMREIVAKVEEQAWPDAPFTSEQKRILLDVVSIESVASAVFKMGNGR